jgi:hypothetical protein
VSLCVVLQGGADEVKHAHPDAMVMRVGSVHQIYIPGGRQKSFRDEKMEGEKPKYQVRPR